MRILLSAFACQPNSGSETGVGWRWAIELAVAHEVVVLTDSSRRVDIEQHPEPLPASLEIVYYRPRFLRNMELNSRTAYLVYQCWQMGAWRVARELDDAHNFDLCWHLTYGVFRQPSWMWKVRKPFVFGPVGGGERAPMRLWRGMPVSEKLRELARDVVNTVSWCLPGLYATYRHADLIITRTEDTRRVLPIWAQKKTVVQQEIGGYPARVSLMSKRGHSGYIKVLFVGRLLGWKGTHLAIRAFSKFLQDGGKGDFTIIGQGRMDKHLRELAIGLGHAEQISFIGQVSQDELFRRYKDFDVLLFPSLHDSGGNVVIESLSFGLPVICLDLGGPRCFVNDTCGIVVPAHQADVPQVIDALADALSRIFFDPAFHKQLCRGALIQAEAMTWQKQVQRVLTIVQGVVK